jgi:hypothetical protein
VATQVARQAVRLVARQGAVTQAVLSRLVA